MIDVQTEIGKIRPAGLVQAPQLEVSVPNQVFLDRLRIKSKHLFFFIFVSLS